MAAAAENAPEQPSPIGGAGLLAPRAKWAVLAIALGPLRTRARSFQTDLAITLGFADTITMKISLRRRGAVRALQVFHGAVDVRAAADRRRAFLWLITRTGSPGSSRS